MKRGQREEADALWKELRRLPSSDPCDPDFRRLRYVRYADDFLLGLAGTHEEAEAIKAQLGTFLRDTLKLDLSEEKTLVSHARTERARFLGYDVHIAVANDQRQDGKRAINGLATLTIPLETIRERCGRYQRHGEAVHRADLLNDEVFSIVARYQAEYRGFVEYYRPAVNLSRLSELKWVMETSLTKTLAHKRKISVSSVYRRYHTTVENGRGRTVKALQIRVDRPGKRPLVATWGGISLARKKNAILDDNPYVVHGGRTELVRKLLGSVDENW